ncbi:hypothetical protein DPMN_011144 [Dreissena polymorpha]|uniref:DNA 3'-5' helicase n=3 Tax=Dreissena polymorpha TaxID=45954 RepID=A0A9D4S1M9_DREPO|nr:hypothetical protein DPMN_011144 [Dreissena polymorpha]
MFMPLYYISQASAYLRFIFGSNDITKSCYAVLYSNQDKCVLNYTINALKAASPVIRLILTSSVAGMGFDPPCVTRIIHAKPPASIAQYLQEIGRAGRRGQQSHAILYYNKRDLAANTPGIQQDIIKYCSDDTRCLREKLLEPFGFQKSDQIANDKCCSICKSKSAASHLLSAMENVEI